MNQIIPIMDVDFHATGDQVAHVEAYMQENGLEYEVFIQNLQQAISQQLDGNPNARFSYEKYNTWDEIAAWTADISAANPTLVTRSSLGNTYNGKPMYLLKLGKSKSGKKAIFMDCGFHAREWISPAFCQWFVKEAVNTYGSDSSMTRILDNLDIYVLPVFNIDGYIYSRTNDRMWRKTRSKNSGSSCIGTDPNRNFDAGWCSVGASSSPCSETYCGTSPESEIESKNLANFIRKNISTIKAYLTIHSYSQLLLFPYSYKYGLTAHHSELNSIASAAVSRLSSLYGTRYTYGAGATTIYPAAGGSDDWAYDEGIRYSFTFELRDTGKYGFLLPESQIKPTCEETTLAVKYIAEYVLDHPY